MTVKLRLATTSLSAGELTPLLSGRSDAKGIYRNGAEILKNWAPLAQGGVRTRPGTRYLAQILASSAAVVLAPFVFNSEQRYAVAFSNERGDIYQPDGTLATSLTSAPWTNAMLPRLTWDQYGDTMIPCHPDMETQKILRTGATSFTRSAYAFENHASGQPRYQPYYKFAEPTMTLTPSATTGSGVTLTLSAPGAWVAAHVGAIVRYKKKEILITGYSSATVATGTVRETLADTTGDIDWDEQVFSAARGYANSCAFFINRFWFGGSKSRPTGIWGTKTGAYFNFDIGTSLPNEAIWESIGGARLSEIRHLLGARHLLIFADRALFYVPMTQSSPVTPENFDTREQQPYGSGYVKPEQFDAAAVFVQNTGAVAREALYVDTDQAYTSDPISLLGSQLISNPTQMAVLYGSAGRPEQYAVLVNGDGQLSVFHSVRTEKIAAWVPWTTDGIIKSVCAVGDELFLAVERTIAAGTVITLEKFDDTAAALDCSKRVTNGSPTKVFPGFTHLANQEVQVVSKGHPLGTYTVSAGGVITLDDLAPEVTEIEAGFAFEQRIRPMPARFDLPEGESNGLVMGLVRTLIQTDRAASYMVDGQSILLNFAGDDFASAAPTKTGWVEVRSLGYDQDARRDIVITDPVKVTILGLNREVLVSE